MDTAARLGRQPAAIAPQRVLVVEDHPRALVAMLTQAGYRVEQATSGREALQLLHAFDPDLVLLDMVLADLRGTDVLAAIRADPRSVHAAVVFLSGREVDAAQQAAGLDAGADGNIARTVSGKELLAWVRTHLRQHELAARLRARERELLSSQLEVRAMADAMPQIVWIASPDGANTHLNRRWVDFTGTSREAGSGDGYMQSFHPEDWQHLRAAWERATTGEADFVVECRLRRRDGQYRWMLNRARPIPGDDGGVTRWIGTCTDIDDLKRAQEAAHVSEQALRQLTLELEGERARLVAAQGVAKVGSWETDLRTFRLAWSAETYRIFDTDPREFQPTHAGFLARVHPEDRALVDTAFRRSITGGAPLVLTHRVATRDGLIKQVEQRWRMVAGGAGEPARAIGTCQDITERVALEERLRDAQRLEAAGQLTGGVAHDFNNLLTVILGNAEMLTEQLVGHAQLAPLAAMVVSAAEHGAELTQRLLAFARRQTLEPKALDVNAQVAALNGLLQRTLGDRILISHAPGAGLWPAWVDRVQLDNALLNLCINSRDAMPHGGRLTISTTNRRIAADAAGADAEVAPGDYVMLAIADTGSGIPPEFLGRVFEPFFTTKGKDKDKGKGLGLAMIYGFVKQSGGHAVIASGPGPGTTVTLYLPRAAGARAAAPAPRSASEPPAALDPGGSETILLVEDDALVRRYAIDQLRSLGYHVIEARHGAQALDVLHAGHPADLLFTDVVMPGMNGRELADAALRLRPGLPVLFTSGYSEDAIIHHGRLDAGVHLLAKPYRREELARRVRGALAPLDSAS
jgi:PAS domain S-box-containing protein